MKESKTLAYGYMRVSADADDKTVPDVEQITFAHRLVDVAELIRRHATTSPIVAEGVVINDRDVRQELQSES